MGKASVYISLVCLLLLQGTAAPGSNEGCTDPAAQNFAPGAKTDDGSCSYVCRELRSHTHTPDTAECFIFARRGDSWPTLSQKSGPEGVVTIPADHAFIVQGMPTLPQLPFRFNVSGGSALVLRYVFLKPPSPEHLFRCGGAIEAQPGATLNVTAGRFDGTSHAYRGGAVCAGASEHMSDSRTIIAISDSTFMGTAAGGGNGGAIYSYHSTVTVLNCTFLNTEAKPFETAKGGAIYGENSDINVFGSRFDHCNLGEDGQVGVANAIYCKNCTKIYIKSTSFNPFVENDRMAVIDDRPVRGRSVDYDTDWLATVGGCSENPCPHGSSCAYANYSLTCTQCPNGTASDDGLTCIPCAAGSQPNTLRATCIPCPREEYSKFGICSRCPNTDETPTEDQTGCEPEIACGIGKYCTANCGGEHHTCEQCLAGQYSPDGLGTQCTRCADGKVPTDDQSKCIRCDDGHEPRTPFKLYNVSVDQCRPDPTRCSSNCVACAGRNYSAPGMPNCVPCPEPSVVSNEKSVCRACGVGTTGNADGSACVPCTGNTFSSADKPGCNPCPRGKHAAQKHATCEDCPYHQDGGNRDDGSCQCADGFYNATAGVILCFEHGYSQKEFDLWHTAAVKEGGANDQCQKCPPCVDCTYSEMVLRHNTSSQHPHVWLLPGWTAHVECNTTQYPQGCSSTSRGLQAPGDHNIFICGQVNRTAGGPNDLSKRRCPGEVAAEGCALNYNGHFCQSCVTGFTKSFNGECEPCGDEQSRKLLWLFGFPILFLSATGFFTWLVKRKKVSTIRLGQLNNGDMEHLDKTPRRYDCVWRRACVRRCGCKRDGRCWRVARSKRWSMLMAALQWPVKIAITYMQVAAQMHQVLQVQYPKKYGDAVAFFGPLAEIDRFFKIFFSADCSGFGDYASFWYLRVLGVPGAAISLVWAMYLIERCVDRSEEAIGRCRENFVRRLLVALFLCYPSICNVTFSTYNCMPINADGSTQISILIDDDRVICQDTSHIHLRVVAAFVIVLIFLVPIVFFAWVIRKSASNNVRLINGHESCQQSLSCCGFGPDRDSGKLTRAFSPGSHTQLEIDIDDVKKRLEAETTDVEVPPGGKHLNALEVTTDDVKAAILACYELSILSMLVDGYRVTWWESVDMLRKLSLVGIVGVGVTRGSVAQIALGTVLSCLFFALHIAVRPLTFAEDNFLRGAAELHIFWTIVSAFMLKADLSHEGSFNQDFYDEVLFWSLILCVVVPSVLAIFVKGHRAWKHDLLYVTDGPRAAFARHKYGFASADDRRQLREYFRKSARDKGAALVKIDHAETQYVHQAPQPEPESAMQTPLLGSE
jgi:hypothetical protein